MSGESNSTTNNAAKDALSDCSDCNISHHDISDEVWQLIKPHLSERSSDNRRSINAVLWVIRDSKNRWEDLPSEYGDRLIVKYTIEYGSLYYNLILNDKAIHHLHNQYVSPL